MILWTGNLSSVALLLKISENLLLSRSKRRANFHILRKISFVHAQFMRVPNLHTVPNRHLIKIRTFLRKIDSYLEKCKFATRFEGLRLDQIS